MLLPCVTISRMFPFLLLVPPLIHTSVCTSPISIEIIVHFLYFRRSLHFLLLILVLPFLLSFSYIFAPSLLFMSPSSKMGWDIRSWMPAFAAPACWLSLPPQSSLFTSSLLSTLKLFTYSICMLMHLATAFLFVLLSELHRISLHLLSLFFFICATQFSWNIMLEKA